MNLNFSLDLRAALYPAEDMPGVWIAHSLDWDVIGHGQTHAEALNMLTHAVGEMLNFKLVHGMAVKITPAPPEIWALAVRAGMPPEDAHPLKAEDAFQIVSVQTADPTVEQGRSPTFVSETPPIFAAAC